jgi:hypothetical protein
LIQKQIQKQIETFKSLVDTLKEKWISVEKVAKQIWYTKQLLYYYYNEVLTPSKIGTLEIIINKIKKEFNL